MSVPVASLALAGVPPVGAGIYDPQRRRVGEGWSFLACSPGHAGPLDWLFVGPDASRPESIDATIDRLLAAVGPLTPGIIVDPEPGWAGHEDALRQLGRRLRAAAVRTRVIVTSHGGFPIEPLAQECAGLVVGSPQLYATPADNAHTWSRWRRAFGRRLIPSIAGPRGTTSYNAGRDTASGYRTYLDSLPGDVPGVIAWDLTATPPWVLEQIRARWPRPLAAAWGALAALDTWAGLVVALAVVAVALLTLLGGV